MFSDVLIGKTAKVIGASDKSLVSRSGTILDETRKILMVRNEYNDLVKVPKKDAIFEVRFGDRKVVISGEDIMGTAQERIYKL